MRPPLGIADRSRHAVLGDVTAGDDIDWPGPLSCRYHEPALVSRGQADGRARRRSVAIATPSSAVKRRITGGSTVPVLVIRDRGRNRHPDSHQLIHQPAQATACQPSSDEKPRVMRGGACCANGKRAHAAISRAASSAVKCSTTGSICSIDADQDDGRRQRGGDYYELRPNRGIPYVEPRLRRHYIRGNRRSPLGSRPPAFHRQR